MAVFVVFFFVRGRQGYVYSLWREIGETACQTTNESNEEGNQELHQESLQSNYYFFVLVVVFFLLAFTRIRLIRLWWMDAEEPRVNSEKVEHALQNSKDLSSRFWPDSRLALCAREFDWPPFIIAGWIIHSTGGRKARNILAPPVTCSQSFLTGTVWTHPSPIEMFAQLACFGWSMFVWSFRWVDWEPHSLSPVPCLLASFWPVNFNSNFNSNRLMDGWLAGWLWMTVNWLADWLQRRRRRRPLFGLICLCAHFTPSLALCCPSVCLVPRPLPSLGLVSILIWKW